MKLRYFLSIIASVLMFAGCVQESIDSFESIKLDKTYLTIPEAGGEVELTITATQDWNFVETEMWPRVIAYQKDSNGKEIKDADGNKVIDEEKTVPSWLTLKGEMSGKAGETKVVFAAEPTNGGREIELSIKAGNNVQYFRVRQGTMLASDATCAEVIAGVDGKSYRVQGVCTSIANDYYGNFYLNDGTGEIYIYGTKDGDGQYNWDDFNIEVGDSVKVEGPRKDYNGTIELVDALFIKVIKSLIKLVEPTDKMVSEEGETFDVKLAYKGKGVFYTVADECSSWVKIEGMTSKSGEPTKLEPNPADTAIVTVTVAPYDEPSSRTGSIEFSSSLDDAKSVITFAFRQGVAEVSVADFLEKEVGDTPYKLTGKIANLNNTTYGNFDLVDATGSIYVYGLTATKVASNDKSFSTLGLREGDIVTIIGTRGEYKEVPQVAGPAYYVSHIGSTDITVKEFLEKEKSKDVWYRLTGKVTGLKTGDYGNFHLVDETGSVYVYGLTKAPVAKNDKSFPTLGVKEGDIVTLVGTRDRYDSAKIPEEKEQVGGPAYYISHVAGEGGDEPDEPETPAEPTVATVAEFLAAAEDATVYELSGTISEITTAYSEQYGNISFKLTDETETVLIYRMSCEGIENPSAIAVGDKVTVQGTRSSYNNAPQMAAGSKCISYTAGEQPETPAEPTVATVAEFLAAAEDDTVYELSGTISEITTAYSEQYGNISFKLTDETETVAIFRMSCEGIENPSAIAVGDKVTVQGKRSSYNGTPQMAAGSKCISYTAGEQPETPAEPTVATVAEFLAAAEDATVYELSGTISEITTAYSEQYGNISFKLTDETETVLIFRMSCEGIENPSAIAVGDKVTVQGTRSSYNNAPQMAAGSKCVSYTAGEGGDEPDEPETPADPNTLLDENFSSLKTWSTTTVNTLQVNGMTWTTAGGTMFGQDGCIKFGKSKAEANVGVKLPKLTALTSATNVTLTFKAVSSDAAYKLKVSATGGATVGTLTPAAITKHSVAINSGADTKTQLQAAFDASTSSFSVTIENVTADTEITIVADGSAKRWYFDDVKIVKAGAADTGASSSLPIEDWQTSSYSK